MVNSCTNNMLRLLMMFKNLEEEKEGSIERKKRSQKTKIWLWYCYFWHENNMKYMIIFSATPPSLLISGWCVITSEDLFPHYVLVENPEIRIIVRFI